ncbi:MAG: YhbY family RNA-binding protein [Candidatus Woesearchaeota archaeon]
MKKIDDTTHKKEKKKSKIQIGKKGITESILSEIERQLKTHELVEIKLLKSFRQGMDKKELINKIEEIAKITNSKIVSIKGFTLLITQKKDKTKF